MDAPSGNTLNSTLHEDVDSSDTSDGEIGFQDDDSYPSGAPGMNYGHGSVHGPRRGGFTELLREKWQALSHIALSGLLPAKNGGVGSSISSGSSGSGSYHELAPSGDYQSEKEPTTVRGVLRAMMLSSWLNALLVFVPFGFVTYILRASPVLVFFTNSMAIVPLSALLTDATERIAHDAGDAIGAMLNISLGNLVELILLCKKLRQRDSVALKNDHIRIVQASILGSILVNILLILGSALLACSVFDVKTVYSTAGTQLLGCLLFVSVFTFLMPTAFDYTFKDTKDSGTAISQMSRISAVMVLAIYILYFVHELKPRQGDGASVHGALDGDVESQLLDDIIPEQSAPSVRSQQSLALPPRTIRFASEEGGESGSATRPALKRTTSVNEADLSRDDDARSTAPSEDRGRPSAEVSRVPLRSAYHQRARSHSGSAIPLSRDSSMASGGRRVIVRSAVPTLHLMRTSFDELRPPMMLQPPEPDPAPRSRSGVAANRIVSIAMLIVTSAIMSVCAEFLVSTIDEVTHAGHLSESLIGLIILPIVGNMAEYVTVVTVAVKGKLDLAIAVSVGSSIQIALCVTPLTVLAGWLMDKDLVLTFTFFEMATLVGTVLLVNLVILTESGGAKSTSSALRGGLICGCYAIITNSIGAYLSPEE